MDEAHAIQRAEPSASPIAQDPNESAVDAPPTLKERANAAQNRGDHAEADRLWVLVLAEAGDDAEALCNRAFCLLNLGDEEGASTYIRRTASSATMVDQPWIRLGSKLVELHRYEDACSVYRPLAAGFPGRADIWNHLGAAELGVPRPPAALASFRRAIDIQPTMAAAWCNLVLALFALDRLPEALAASRRALALEPVSAVAAFNASAVLLAMGRLKAGFAAYEYRFALPGAGWPRHEVVALPWLGEPLKGRSVVVFSEQANGDCLQFCRYVAELARRGARVTFEVPERLHRLMSSLHGDIALTASVEGGSRFDHQVSLMSIPLRCGIEGDRVLAEVPYLAIPEERVDHWKRRIGAHGFRVGVAWEGHRYPGSRDLNRSFPADALLPLAQVPGVRLISLQRDLGLDQLSRLPPGMAIEAFDGFDAGDHAFLDAAAVVTAVDLVVTLDSAMAHLAGALGRPTWLALPFAPEWRWQRGRADTPWYPTMRLFRQGVLGDWDGVFRAMAEALAPLAGAREPSAPAAPQPRLPVVPTSCGEVLDKITILEIKVERLGVEAAARAADELRLLHDAARGFGPLDDEARTQFDELRRVNRELWDVEDSLRLCEARDDFEAAFVSLARSVYRLNDERARLKRALNILLNSALHEQKGYGATG